MPRITVRPSAKAAATARIGYSSTIEGERSGGTSTPRRTQCRAVTSPTGSPPSCRTPVISRSAPISFKVSNSPARSGLSSTPSTVTSDPGVISAATRGKAADEGSPGTRMEAARRRWAPAMRMRRPSGTSSTSTAAPKARSIRSVWSRVASGSTTSTPSWAFRPASSTADFTCADGTGTT